DLVVALASPERVLFTGTDTPGGVDAIRRAVEPSSPDASDAGAGALLQLTREGFVPLDRPGVSTLGVVSSPPPDVDAREPAQSHPEPLGAFVPFVMPRLVPVDAPSERLLGHSPAPEVGEALALVAPVRAMRLPAPPEDLSLSAMNEWASGPFS